MRGETSHFRLSGDGPMSRSASMFSRSFIGVLLLTWLMGLGPFNASAAFIGDYDETRWTLKTYGGDGALDWLVDSFLLDTGFTGSGSQAVADVTVRATRSGTYYFSWTFYGGTSIGYKLARLRNESVTTLVTREAYAEGTASFSANAGDLIGVRLTAPLDEFPAMAEISGFFAPGQEPAILVQPGPAAACLGAAAIFSVVATNAVDYQWQFKGQNISEEIFEDLVVQAIPPADAGNYRVIARNPLGSATSQAVPLQILYAPVITSQPPAVLIQCAGQNATWTVGATGSNLRYQWRRDEAILAGATTAALTLSNVSAALTGFYDVIISNACARVISEPVAFSVSNPPLILTQPQSRTCTVGETISFFAIVSGIDSIHSQWQRNGTNLPWANGAILTLANVQASDAGNYSVVLSNPCGSTTSASATLTVTPVVSIRIVPETDDSVSIEVSGPVGRSYALEISDDLKKWTRKGTNSLVLAGSPLFHDVTTIGVRYYRVCPLP
jgi:hypothetical protein